MNARRSISQQHMAYVNTTRSSGRRNFSRRCAHLIPSLRLPVAAPGHIVIMALTNWSSHIHHSTEQDEWKCILRVSRSLSAHTNVPSAGYVRLVPISTFWFKASGMDSQSRTSTRRRTSASFFIVLSGDFPVMGTGIYVHIHISNCTKRLHKFSNPFDIPFHVRFRPQLLWIGFKHIQKIS